MRYFKDIFENKYHKFIVLTIKESKTKKDINEIKTLFVQLDFSKLFKISQDNEVESIIVSNLIELDIRNFPNYWYESYNNLKNQIYSYYSELSNISKLMANYKVPLIVLKNGAIASSIMNDFGKCPMGDIDTLVNKKDFIKAHKILTNNDYVFKFRSKIEVNDLENAYKNGSTEYYKYLGNKGKMWFELSWRAVSGRWIRPDQEPNTEVLIKNSIKNRKTGIRVLSREDNLLQVALHTAKHSYVRAPGFRLHLDVERIVKHQEINWSLFLKKVKEANCCVPVYFSLYIPKILFKTPIPQYVLDEIRPGNIREKLILHWLDKVGIMNPKDNKFSKSGFIIFHILLYDSFSGFIKALFPSTKWIKDKYGLNSNVFVPIAIIRRIFDLVFRRNI